MVPVNEFMNTLSKSIDNINPEMLEEMLKSIKPIRKDMPGFKEVEHAFELINSPIPIYAQLAYFFQTENLRYMKDIVPNNMKSAFTITGPGNSILELVNLGAKNIVAVDNNPVNANIAKLFIASFLTLSSKEYDRFLLDYENPNFLSLDYLKNVKEGFKGDEAAYNFWDSVLINDKEDLLKFLFKPINSDYSHVKFGMPFIKKYYDVRDKLESVNIDIKTADALEYFESNPDKKFDYIDISNILLFIYQVKCDCDREKFLAVLNSLNKIYIESLNPNGTFVFDYFFGHGLNDILDDDSDMTDIHRDAYLQTFKYLRNNFDIEIVSVEKLINLDCKDNDTVLFTRKKSLIIGGKNE